jgi:solute carrier family 35 (adenosine 3'-phospho 5'-phosphosulfate transporter), member B3
VQFMIYVAMSSYQLHTEKALFVRKAPLSRYALIGFLSVATVGLSNVACQYLNYPTQVLFKSCKTIPVMLVGVCYLGKR